MLDTRNNIICPVCNSRKIFELKIDADWSYGTQIGQYFTTNDDKYYTKKELKYDIDDRPNIEILHCGDCKNIFK
jgi:hypothetical protein